VLNWHLSDDGHVGDGGDDDAFGVVAVVAVVVGQWVVHSFLRRPGANVIKLFFPRQWCSEQLS